MRLVALFRGKLGAARYRLAMNLGHLRASWHSWRDWRTHVRAHPISAGALAVLLGFIVVPKRDRGAPNSADAAAGLLGTRTAAQATTVRTGFVEDATRRLARFIVEGLVAAAFREVALARARNEQRDFDSSNPANAPATRTWEQER
jgi:hypothetical protein